MTDREFLIWIHERLEYVHKENPHMDYMHRLRNIIVTIDPDKETLGTAAMNNSEDLKKVTCAN